MKKLFFLLIVPFAVISCQKEPDFDELSDDYIVYTTYDPSYNFSTPTNVYVPAAITLFDNDGGTPDVWDDADAQEILDEFSAKLTAAGYTVTDIATGANLQLNVSFLESVTYYVDYYDYYWWWYPYWWDGGYWPYWYYPYPAVYGYATGSLIAELVDPAKTNKDDKTLPTVWYAYIAGDESGSEDYDTARILTGVDKAFAQSPYLKK